MKVGYENTNNQIPESTPKESIPSNNYGKMNFIENNEQQNNHFFEIFGEYQDLFEGYTPRQYIIDYYENKISASELNAAAGGLILSPQEKHNQRVIKMFDFCGNYCPIIFAISIIILGFLDLLLQMINNYFDFYNLIASLLTMIVGGVTLYYIYKKEDIKKCIIATLFTLIIIVQSGLQIAGYVIGLLNKNINNDLFFTYIFLYGVRITLLTLLSTRTCNCN